MAGKVIRRPANGPTGAPFVAVVLGSLLAVACKSKGGDSTTDAGADASADAGLPGCAAVDAGALSGGAVQDDFGPNALPAKMSSALGRVNVYEVTNPRLLERVEVYLATPLAQSRLTIAIHEAFSNTMPFHKLTDVQVDVPSCLGWASSGPVAVPLVAGRYYAIGFDPNQAIQPYVDTEADDIPVDGRVGRLVGSKTATSVSVATLTWEKVVTTEFTRQRLSSSPRVEVDAGGTDASADGAALDGGANDLVLRDGGTSDAATVDSSARDATSLDAPAGG